MPPDHAFIQESSLTPAGRSRLIARRQAWFDLAHSTQPIDPQAVTDRVLSFYAAFQRPLPEVKIYTSWGGMLRDALGYSPAGKRRLKWIGLLDEVMQIGLIALIILCLLLESNIFGGYISSGFCMYLVAAWITLADKLFQSCDRYLKYREQPRLPRSRPTSRHAAPHLSQSASLPLNGAVYPLNGAIHLLPDSICFWQF